jgi:hypothetical protein
MENEEEIIFGVLHNEKLNYVLGQAFLFLAC